MKSVKVLFGALLCCVVATATAADSTQVVDFIYQVKKGDTLESLSAQYWDTPTRWREVSRYNQLNNSNKIEPGMNLRIRTVWLKRQNAKATVEAMTGQARADGRLVAVGERVAQGATVETAAEATLRLRLPDGSAVNLQPQTELNLTTMEQNQANMFKTLLRMVSGEVDVVKKKYAQGQAELALNTRVAAIGVRGTHFRVRHTAQNDVLEVEEGLVSLSSPKSPKPLLVGGGFGALVDEQHPAEMLTLLPAPNLPQPSAPLESATLNWEIPAVEGAQAIRGELAQDEFFSKRVQAVSVQNNTLHLEGLRNGKYWLKLRAVDSHGLQGMEGKTSFEVNAPPPLMALVRAYVKPESVELRWMGRGEQGRYHVQVANNPEFTSPLLDQESEQLATEISCPPSGRYFFRVRQINSQRQANPWDAPVVFEVR